MKKLMLMFSLVLILGMAGCGDDGEQGPAGAKGEAGAAGKDGRDGTDGKPGAPGEDGKKGEDGKDGKDGTDGKDGATGPRGAVLIAPTLETALDLADGSVVGLVSPEGAPVKVVKLKAGNKADSLTSLRLTANPGSLKEFNGVSYSFMMEELAFYELWAPTLEVELDIDNDGDLDDVLVAEPYLYAEGLTPKPVDGKLVAGNWYNVQVTADTKVWSRDNLVAPDSAPGVIAKLKSFKEIYEQYPNAKILDIAIIVGDRADVNLKGVSAQLKDIIVKLSGTSFQYRLPKGLGRYEEPGAPREMPEVP